MKKSKLRVALLSSGLGHVRRGIETWTDDLGRELAARGIDVTVYKGGGQRVLAHERVVASLQRGGRLSRWIIRHRPGFLWRVGFASGYSLEELTFCWLILPTLLIRQFDIIHTQDPDIALFYQRLRKIGLIRSKVIFAHGTEESFDFLKKFTCVQHLAPYHLDEAVANGVSNTHAFAIGNFVDTDVFSPRTNAPLRRELNIPPGAFVVLSIAAVKKQHKRIDYLIAEVAALNNPDVYLVVAGAKEAETAAVIAAGEKALGVRGIFLVNLSRERVAELLGIADVFVLCSLKEMMPIALLEALACNLPCLIHSYPVEQWMVADGGESLDMAKPGELGQVILKYLSPEYRSGKAQKARQQAVKNFSKEVILSRVIKMYEAVL